MRTALTVVALLVAFATGCVREIPAAERGAEMFSDPGLSPSNLNEVSCATCHSTEATEMAERRFAGETMWGVTRRTRYWGGQITTLRGAVDHCLEFFMRGRPLDPDDLDARALHEYLASLGPEGPTDARPMTVIERVDGLPEGDRTRGEATWRAACQPCHGETHSGEGRLPGRDLEDIILPQIAIDLYPELFPEFPAGLVVIEKVRHGGFITTAGVMPFFSVERLSDDELADILTYLELPSLE